MTPRYANASIPRRSMHLLRSRRMQSEQHIRDRSRRVGLPSTAPSGRLDRYANLGSASSLAPLLNPTIGFGCANNVRSMTAKRSRKRVASVREYVASKPKESRASLEAVRRAILKALPNAQEGLAYQMPAYTLNGVGVQYFAGWKSHYSLYPASDALVEAFAKELAPYPAIALCVPTGRHRLATCA